jgi:LmbE family N-acetylglucosaminyl deacetylase
MVYIVGISKPENLLDAIAVAASRDQPTHRRIDPRNSMTEPAILFLHAHPDDEAVLTGSILAKATAQGLRTIVAYGTRGDAGETHLDLEGETLADRRIREAEAACVDLGVDRIEWLTYDDSGMDGTETTSNPAAFSNADPGDVARELARLLDDEDVVAIVGYDANGTYGHPDHKQVHHVAHAAAPLLGSDWVLDATYNREHQAQLPDADGTLDPGYATAEADLTHFVDGDEWFALKMKALMNHTSQVPDDLDVDNPPLEDLKARFGTEWFILAASNGATDLGVLEGLLEPKDRWVSSSS